MHVETFATGPDFKYVRDHKGLRVVTVGNPSELLKVYEMFLLADTARLLKGIRLRYFIFPEGTKPRYDSLDELMNGISDICYQGVINDYYYERAICMLREYDPSNERFEDFEGRLERERRTIGFRIDYGNRSYINIYTRADPHLLNGTGISIGQDQLAISYSSIDPNEFVDIDWSLVQVFRFTFSERKGIYISEDAQ